MSFITMIEHIEDSNLNEILTPEFWDKFYEYIENEN